MSSRDSSDTSSRKKLKDSDMLVPVVNARETKSIINVWRERMIPRMKEWFGIYCACLSSGTAVDWMDPDALYPEVGPPPSKTTHYNAYRSYIEKMDVWYGHRSDYQNKKHTMTTVLFEGCLSKASQMRMREQQRAEVERLLENGDLLAMYKLIVRVHSYTGVTTKNDDNIRVRKEFMDFVDNGLRPGDTLPQYKLKFDLLEQKLRDFELEDAYSAADRMTIYLSPLKQFPNRHVSAQVIEWTSGVATLPGDILTAHNILECKYEASTSNGHSNSDRGARVHTMRLAFGDQEVDLEGHVETDENGNSRVVPADGAVFTALASVNKAFKKKISGNSNSSSSPSKDPKFTGCFNCGSMEHYASNCPNGEKILKAGADSNKSGNDKSYKNKSPNGKSYNKKGGNKGGKKSGGRRVHYKKSVHLVDGEEGSEQEPGSSSDESSEGEDSEDSEGREIDGMTRSHVSFAKGYGNHEKFPVEKKYVSMIKAREEEPTEGEGDKFLSPSPVNLNLYSGVARTSIERSFENSTLPFSIGPSGIYPGYNLIPVSNNEMSSEDPPRKVTEEEHSRIVSEQQFEALSSISDTDVTSRVYRSNFTRCHDKEQLRSHRSFFLGDLNRSYRLSYITYEDYQREIEAMEFQFDRRIVELEREWITSTEKSDRATVARESSVNTTKESSSSDSKVLSTKASSEIDLKKTKELESIVCEAGRDTDEVTIVNALSNLNIRYSTRDNFSGDEENSVETRLLHYPVEFKKVGKYLTDEELERIAYANRMEFNRFCSVLPNLYTFRHALSETNMVRDHSMEVWSNERLVWTEEYAEGVLNGDPSYNATRRVTTYVDDYHSFVNWLIDYNDLLRGFIKSSESDQVWNVAREASVCYGNLYYFIDEETAQKHLEDFGVAGIECESARLDVLRTLRIVRGISIPIKEYEDLCVGREYAENADPIHQDRLFQLINSICPIPYVREIHERLQRCRSHKFKFRVITQILGLRQVEQELKSGYTSMSETLPPLVSDSDDSSSYYPYPDPYPYNPNAVLTAYRDGSDGSYATADRRSEFSSEPNSSNNSGTFPIPIPIVITDQESEEFPVGLSVSSNHNLVYRPESGERVETLPDGSIVINERRSIWVNRSPASKISVEDSESDDIPDLVSNSDSSDEGVLAEDAEEWEIRSESSFNSSLPDSWTTVYSSDEWRGWRPEIRVKGPLKLPAVRGLKRSRKGKRGKKPKKRKGKTWKRFVFSSAGRRENKGDSSDEEDGYQDANEFFPRGDLPEGEHKDLWPSDVSGTESGNSTDSDTRRARARAYEDSKEERERKRKTTTRITISDLVTAGITYSRNNPEHNISDLIDEARARRLGGYPESVSPPSSPPPVEPSPYEEVTEMLRNSIRLGGAEDDDEGGNDDPPVPSGTGSVSSESTGPRSRTRSKRGRLGFYGKDEDSKFVDEYGLLSLVQEAVQLGSELGEERSSSPVAESSESEGECAEECNSEEWSSDRSRQFGKCYTSKIKSDNSNDHFNYCLDSMANVNVFRNRDLLTNIRESKRTMHIDGVGGKSVSIKLIGDHKLFGTCYYCPETEYNVVSQWKAELQGFKTRLSEDNESAWLVRDSDKTSICFNRDPSDHFYKCPYIALVKKQTDGSVNTNFGNLEEIYGNGSQRMLYTQEQLRRADMAEALHVALEHPSDTQLAAFIQSPSTINCPITVQDLKNLRAINGPCRVCLEGKPKPHKGSHSTHDRRAEPTQPGELLHADIIFVKGRPRLFTTDHISGYCTYSILESKSSKNLFEAFDEVINAYRSNLKIVRRISTDAESNLLACENELNRIGVKLESRIPGEHEKYAERATRVVRERMRTKILELPFELPRPLYDSLAAEVIRNMNMLPNSKSIPMTPKEMVTGERVNFITDISAPFGSAGLVPVTNPTQGSEQKNQVGIVMGVAGGVKGGTRMYMLDKHHPVNKRNVKPMAMTDYIIEHMNEYANESELKKGKGNVSDDVREDDILQFVDTMGEDGPVNSNDDFYVDGENHRLSFVPNAPGLTKTLVPISYDPRDRGESGVPMTTPSRTMEKQASFPTSPIKSVSKTNDLEPHPVEVEASPAVRLDQVYSDITEDTGMPETSNPVTVKRRGRPSKSVSVPPPAVQPHGMKTRSKAFQMTLSKALESEASAAAKEAAKKELKQLVDLKTWVYLKKKSDATPSVHTKETPCSMFLKAKHDAKGVFLLWKARLVNGGHMTDPNRYDPFEKTAPTIGLEVVMVLLIIAQKKKWKVQSFDVPGAYLNSGLKPDRYHVMRLSGKISKLLQEVDPESKKFVREDGSILVEIRRSLYGLPEAAQLWYDYLSKALLDGGYRRCPNEPCLFIRTKRVGGTSHAASVVCVYVDDCLHIFNHDSMERELYSSLRNANLKDLKISSLSPTSEVSFLGLNISIKQDGTDRVLMVDQSGYLNSILEMYEDEISKLRDAVTPCDENVFKPVDEGPDSEPVNITEFMSKLMRVRYLVRTRPDIELAISALTTKSRAPVKGDMKRLNRVLCYLRATKDLCIVIRTVEELKIYAYMDAGYAVHPKMESHSGVIVTMGKFGPPIHYKSLKQKLVTTSSTEAELVAIYDALDFVLWLRDIWSSFISRRRPQ